MIFQESGFDIATAIPLVSISWIAIFIVVLILINKGKLNKKHSIIIYTIVIVVLGVILGGIPNTVLPIHTILLAIGVSTPFSEELLNIEDLKIKVTEKGFTKISEEGNNIRCATSWKDVQAFKICLLIDWLKILIKKKFRITF